MKSRTLFAAIVAACVMLCACSFPASAEDFAESFGPIDGPTTKSAISGPSAWYTKPSPDYSVDQCNILLDSVGPIWSCVHRLSAMCVQLGQGYSVGYARYDGPVQLPIILPLYQPPSLIPAGYIEIVSLGANPQIGFNGPVVQWTQAAAYQGGSCGEIAQPPPPANDLDPRVLARHCRMYPDLPACRG